MIEKETESAIDAFLEKVGKNLPDNFETEDLLQDLKEHIIEALNEKMQSMPDRSQKELLGNVLGEMGTPEEIAEEISQARPTEEQEKEKSKVRYFTLRSIAFIIVSIPAAWYISQVVESIDFTTTFLVLFIFTILEGIIRNWQAKESS
ncbi:MAG: HAAS signaling domain-containing protein [Candidatus Thorarchaeota archaeon]